MSKDTVYNKDGSVAAVTVSWGQDAKDKPDTTSTVTWGKEVKQPETPAEPAPMTWKEYIRQREGRIPRKLTRMDMREQERRWQTPDKGQNAYIQALNDFKNDLARSGVTDPQEVGQAIREAFGMDENGYTNGYASPLGQEYLRRYK